PDHGKNVLRYTAKHNSISPLISSRSYGLDRCAEPVGDAECAVDEHDVLHVLRPQGGAPGLQRGGDHQRLEHGKTITPRAAERRFMHIKLDRDNGRTDGANGDEIIADFAP